MKRRYDLVPPASPVVAALPNGLWQTLVHLYGSADPRSLGLLRIALGALLGVDLALKFPEVDAHFSNAGWLPNHFALFRPMSEHLFSVYFAFGAPLEVKCFMCLHLAVCLLLLVGYRTKLMQVLALVLTTSLNSRNILIENGGSVVLDILLVWSVFLPLGRRFSVDALRAGLAVRKETTQAALNQRSDPARDARPVVTLAVTALLLQWAIIYFFNTLHKNGAPWRDGTAVHYFLQQDRLVTWFGAWLRDVLPLGGIKFLTFSTLLIEGSVAALLLCPWRTHVTRMLAFAAVALLHLSIDSVLQLGSFSWAMLLAFFAFVPAQAWDWAERRWSAWRTPCVVHFEPQSGASLMLCRVVKRLDALGFVTFRALDETSPKKSEKGLCVSVAGEKSVVGWDALLAIADALWFGRRPLLLLAPFVRRRVSRRLTELATNAKELDRDLGVEAVPTQADTHAAEPSAASRLGAKLLGSLRESAVAFLIVVCASQVLLENQAVPRSLKPQWRPALFEVVIAYPRIFQGWSMFAPTPPESDGRLVIDGRTRDGRRFDPLTGSEPVFEVHPAGTPRTNLIWGYFHTRIVEDRFRAYWSGVRDFVMTHHKLTGRPQDELTSFDAYYVSETFPAPGEKRAPPERRKLFSSSSMPSEGPALPYVHPKSKPSKPRAQ
jgi:Vitamin K-dependent gamma-carboxylase